MRTMTEILIEADEATELKQLYKAWNEFKSNLNKYSLIQKRFALEHLQGLTKKMAQKDIQSILLIELLKL